MLKRSDAVSIRNAGVIHRVNRIWHWFFFWEALLYASGLLLFSGLVSQWHWYLWKSPHREQSEAILRGELALSSDPRDVMHDLCWAESGVHQVWGLGIPLLRLPLDAVAKVCGIASFPDRLALGLFMFAMAYLVTRTLVVCGCESIADRGSHLLGDPPEVFGGAVLLLVFPPFLSLLCCRGGIWEEVLSYCYLGCLALACGLVTLARTRDWAKFWFLCALAGLSGLIRPTMLAYGAATVATAAIVMFWNNERGSARSRLPSAWICGLRVLNGRLSVGIGLFVAGGAALWFTNLLRFGDGFEFGHKLNLQTGSLLSAVFSTRFDYWCWLRSIAEVVFTNGRSGHPHERSP